MPPIRFTVGELDAAKPLPVEWYCMELTAYSSKIAQSGESTNHRFKVKLTKKDNRPFTFFLNDTNPEYSLIPLAAALLGRAPTPEDEIDFEKAVGRRFEGHIVNKLDGNGAMRQTPDAFRPCAH